LASIEVSSEDRPLHEDMRYLAGVLGRVVERLQGPEAFRAVEELRTASRDRRRGDPRLDPRASRTGARSAPRYRGPGPRAFTLFFFLINAAEPGARARRRLVTAGRHRVASTGEPALERSNSF
jgi:phosphoenolpyruvate carboxylase